MSSFFKRAWSLLPYNSNGTEEEKQEALSLFAAYENAQVEQAPVTVQQEPVPTEPLCTDVACNPTVTTCCSIVVPPDFNAVNLFVGQYQQLSFSADCLTCITEECLLPASAPNPCGGDEIEGFIRVNRVRALGCIKYNVNLFGLVDGLIRFPSFITQGQTSLCCRDSVCFNQTICLVPEGELDCPDFSQIVGSAVIESVTNIPCGSDPDGGGRLVTLRITFTMPTCSGEPEGFVGVFASPNTVCAQGTGGNNQSTIFGYLVDGNGAPVSGATVTFSVDDPDKGSVSPTSFMTGPTGLFFTTFTSGTETGTAVVTISSGDAETTVNINVVDCTP